MRQLWTDEAFRRLALMALAGILAVAMAVRFVADYRAGRIQKLRDRYKAKWMEYELAEVVFSDDVVVFCFLFSIRYFFGKDYAVFEMVARFVGQ